MTLEERVSNCWIELMTGEHTLYVNSVPCLTSVERLFNTFTNLWAGNSPLDIFSAETVANVMEDGNCFNLLHALNKI